jgi:Putative bacterial sensory transduction regulator
LASTVAVAEDKGPCGAGLVCANAPATVLKGLQDAGYRAKLDKDSAGDPTISSSASGYNYEIYFYGCKANVNCDSLQFHISFEKDDANTPELANKWNRDKRFGQASISDKGSFVMGFDVTTQGGLNAKNFADVVDWWQVTLGNLRTFFAENPPPK